MRKGIYLNVLMHVEEHKPAASTTAHAVGPSGESPAKPTANPLDEIKQAMETLTQGILPEDKITVEVKRIRTEPSIAPNDKQVSVLAYVEGEQDAPLNFMELATAELKKKLDMTFGQSLASGTNVQVHTIEENTNAVDELADEAEF
ncbi:MAG: hypothetical protein ABI947_16200 [Chloroflexota bacterium]